MEYRTLKDIAKITMGQSPDSSSYNKEKDGLPFFQGNADFGELYPNERIWCNEPKKVAMPGDILISVRAPIGALNYSKEKSCIGRGLAAITIKNVVERNYIFHLLRARNKYLNSKGTGSTFKAIGKNVIEEVPVPQISGEEQQKCVNVIDLIESIIIERKSQIDKLDELVRARFVEMFNGKNYPREELENLSHGKGEYGAQSASVEYNSSRPRYVRITDIKEDGSLNDDFVCSANIEDDELYKLEYGDFCFARMGATVGKTYAYRGGNQIFAGYLIRYKLNLNRIIPEYLYEFTRLHEYRNWVSLNQSGAAQPGINAKKYGSLRIPVAPLEEQRVFAKFVGQVDKSKVEVQKALDKAQLLFDSLMQKYFG